MKFLINRSRRWKIIAVWILAIALVIVSVLAIPGPAKFFVSGIFLVVALQFTIFARFIDTDHFPFSAFFLCAGAYFFSFGSVILLSLDLGYTIYYRHEKDEQNQRTLQYVLIILWNIFYWGKVSFLHQQLIFGTLLVKFYQKYWRTGHFSTCSRVKQSLKMLLIPIIIIAVLVVVCLIFVYSLITTQLLLGAKMVLIGISHIYNFTILIILLGFGLLSFPISLWTASNFSYILYSKVQNAARYYRQFRDAYVQFYTNVNTIRTVIEEIQPTDPAYDYVDILESELPEKDEDGIQIGASRSRTFQLKKGQEYNENVLAKLRQQFKVSFFLYKRKRAKWISLINEVERVMKPRALSNDQKEEVARINVLRSAHSISQDSTHDSNSEFKTYTPQIYPRKPSTFYKCWTKFFAVLFFLLSLGVIFAETTLMFDQTLSPFYQILHHIGSIYMTVVLSLVCISYLFFISFFTFFRFELSDFYQMVPFHTDSLTLSFNASQCAKIAPVICYNFLSLVKQINYPSDLYGTAFDDFYSKSINNIPFLGTIYSFAIPILVLLLALVSLLCLSKRCTQRVQKKFKRFSKNKVAKQNTKELSYVEKMEQGEKEIFKQLDRRNRERSRKATELHNQNKREKLNQKKSQKLIQEERSYRRATLQNTELSQQMIDYNAAQMERDLDFANQEANPEFQSITAQLANFGSKKKGGKKKKKESKRKSKAKSFKEEATFEMPENALNAFMKEGRVRSLQEEVKQEANFNKRRESVDSQSSRKSVDYFSGFLYKRSSKKFTLQKWKKKYCVLKDFFLCLYENQEAEIPLKQINLSQVLAIDKHYSQNAMVKSKKLGANKLDLTRFDIVLPTYHFKFRSDNIAQSEEWIAQLLKAKERGKRRQFA